MWDKFSENTNILTTSRIHAARITDKTYAERSSNYSVSFFVCTIFYQFAPKMHLSLKISQSYTVSLFSTVPECSPSHPHRIRHRASSGALPTVPILPYPSSHLTVSLPYLNILLSVHTESSIGHNLVRPLPYPTLWPSPTVVNSHYRTSYRTWMFSFPSTQNPPSAIIRCTPLPPVPFLMCSCNENYGNYRFLTPNFAWTLALVAGETWNGCETAISYQPFST